MWGEHPATELARCGKTRSRCSPVFQELLMVHSPGDSPPTRVSRILSPAFLCRSRSSEPCLCRDDRLTPISTRGGFVWAKACLAPRCSLSGPTAQRMQRFWPGHGPRRCNLSSIFVGPPGTQSTHPHSRSWRLGRSNRSSPRVRRGAPVWRPPRSGCSRSGGSSPHR